MSQILTIQELAIVIAVKTENPNILTEEFLKFSGIVPASWELDSEPTYNNRIAQLIFKNGFSIALQPDRVMFMEAIAQKVPEDIVAGEIAENYIKTMRLAEYRAVGINVRSFLEDAANPDAITNYITKELLGTGMWKEHGDNSLAVSLGLGYQLEGRKLNLTINEASIRLPNQPPTMVVLFSGNYEYSLLSTSIEERSLELTQIVQNWQQDFTDHTDLITNKFLSAQVAIHSINS
jgi:hypothetical protein